MVHQDGHIRASDAAERSGGTWEVVEPAHEIVLPVPRQCGALPFAFEERYGPLPSRLGSSGVLALPGGRVSGEHGWPLTNDRQLIADATAVPAYRLDVGPVGAPPEVRRLAGRVVSLTSVWAGSNFAHFLVDGLARLALVERSAVGPSDWYVVAPTGGAEDWVERAGLPLDRVVWARPGVEYVADELVVSSFPRPGRVCPAWLPEWLRRRLGVGSDDRDAATDVVYLARRAPTRMLTSSRAIEARMAALGGRVLMPAVGVDVRADLARARVIIGPHGAGLTNLVFAPPGGRMLFLVPTDQPDSFFFTLAAAARMECFVLVGASDGVRAGHVPGPSPFDFDVDHEELDHALRLVLADD